ncbi:PREDICTED: uncharacterized protein LOC104799612 [Tarenaya hassleriana]|uniref:uncharacterized protein LOC104799612 n=1 Tax=Tarenaya hassleriana TaxID=28532 RepID=UPI00053C4D96|nr:PREDICTED: uncharacterized protein LOC104799612 [Tarenaya hassleriana]
MLTKRSHPMIGKLSELLVSVNRSNPFSDALMMTTTSPKSPLDFKIFPQISPRNGAKRFYDSHIGGVGLGIVAALENSTARMSVCRVGKYPVPKPGPNRSGSNPVPIAMNNRRSVDDDNDDEEEERFMDEDYTYVTCHHGPDGSCTRVYRDGIECYARKNPETERSLVFGDCFDDPPENSPETSPEFEGLDFLNACLLCRKKLHGIDIYIYKGDKAFCSAECRSIHITSDERRETCRSDFSISPYTAGEFLSGGVLAI